MRSKRNLWIFIGIVIFTAALVSGFILMQPSVEDILVQTIETAQTISDGHAIVSIDVDSLEKDASGTVEIWALRGQGSGDGEHHHGAFRVEVLESNEEKAQGAVIVSDGETLWAYSPSENKVFVGTPEEAQSIMEENELLTSEIGQFHEGQESTLKDVEHEHPENAEEAVAKLKEYFNISKAGTGSFAGETANLLKVEPIPEQMPDEYLALGGLIELWVGQDSNLPLAVAYTGGSMGDFNATVLKFEVNAGVDETLFTFEIPADAEVITLADLEPQSLTLEEAGANAEFEFLTPGKNAPAATLVEILEVRGSIVQRYTLPAGGSFTIAQGIIDENSEEVRAPSTESQSVQVRGSTGNLYVSEDGSKILLTWTEGDLFYSVAGDLTPADALNIAESLQ